MLSSETAGMITQVRVRNISVLYLILRSLRDGFRGNSDSYDILARTKVRVHADSLNTGWPCSAILSGQETRSMTYGRVLDSQSGAVASAVVTVKDRRVFELRLLINTAVDESLPVVGSGAATIAGETVGVLKAGITR